MSALRSGLALLPVGPLLVRLSVFGFYILRALLALFTGRLCLIRLPLRLLPLPFFVIIPFVAVTLLPGALFIRIAAFVASSFIKASKGVLTYKFYKFSGRLSRCFLFGELLRTYAALVEGYYLKCAGGWYGNQFHGLILGCGI